MQRQSLAILAIAAFLLPLLSPATGRPALASPPDVAAQSEPLPRKSRGIGIRPGAETEGGIVMDAVAPGRAAERAGIRAGDLLLSIGGMPTRNADELLAAVRGFRAEQTVPVELRRGGESIVVPLTFDDARESVEGSEVRYESVVHRDGYRLRTIVTEPKASPLARAGRMPALLYVQGIACDSIDRPSMPDAVDTRIVHAMAKAGFVTMRVDKPGLGDSEGPDCSEIDLSTELEGYRAALAALAARPSVDPERVYLFGHSMGGVMAPYLSASTPVRGTIVYGTLVRTWFEYQLENVRRQAELSGASPAEVTAAVQAEARSSATILVDKKTLGDVWERWPELRQPPQGTTYGANHMSTRHMRFFHELQDLNLAEAWEKSTGAVLALWGEFDWVAGREDHERIAAIVNRRTPGAGSMLVMPKADHAFTTHPTIGASVAMYGRGLFDESLAVRMQEWIAGLENGAAPATDEDSPLPEDSVGKRAASAAMPAWTKLATEAYPGKQDDVAFIDADRGFYGNGAGRIFRTSDGGTTWSKIFEKPGTFVRCLATVGEKVVIMGNIGPGYFPGVTDETPLYRSEDGGETWSPVTSIEGPPVVGLCALTVVEVPFVNAGNLDRRPRIVGVGRVGGPTAYVWSDDLGKTWRQAALPEVAAMAFDVHFLDESNGFIAAATSVDVARSNGLILATKDGGATWNAVHRSSRPFELTWKFAFPSATTGYCTLQSYDPDPANKDRFVLKSTDGGATWSEVPLVADHAVRPFGIAFVDDRRGWVGATPHGFATTDGGATWTKAGFGNAVNKIRLVPADGGIVAYAIGVELHRTEIPGPSLPRPAAP